MSIILLHFYIIGCIFALLIWDIYLYDNYRGDISRILTKLKCDKIIIISLFFSWLTVILQIYKFKRNMQ